MEFDRLEGPRFELALERLRAGDIVRYQGLLLRIGADGVLECDVPSSWQPESATEATAAADLQRAEFSLQDLIRAAAESGIVGADRPPRLTLVDDYGKGSVALAYWDAGRVRWAQGFKPLT